MNLLVLLILARNRSIVVPQSYEQRLKDCYTVGKKNELETYLSTDGDDIYSLRVNSDGTATLKLVCLIEQTGNVIRKWKNVSGKLVLDGCVNTEGETVIAPIDVAGPVGYAA